MGFSLFAVLHQLHHWSASNPSLDFINRVFRQMTEPEVKAGFQVRPLPDRIALEVTFILPGRVLAVALWTGTPFGENVTQSLPWCRASHRFGTG